MFDLSEKIILITGSSRGLGFTFARGLAKAGAKVVLNSLHAETIHSALKQMKDEDLIAQGTPFDVTDSYQVETSIDKIEREIGPVDVLINNAGIHRRAPLMKMSMDEWKQVMEVNLNAVFFISQVVARNMISRNKGKIINITSLNAEAVRPTIANYCAAKGGLKMLTKSMATEWGPYNIQTNAIGPGYFKTDLTEKLVKDPDFDSWVKKEVPLGRWGEPEELVGAIIFLASEASSYINGHTLYIDGGWQASL
jgi:gluconate 5-dehydrogenase